MKRGFTLIELLVVVGIAAMLITMASTSFFGAMRQEGVTKSRNQLRDILLLARQQACVMGQTHVVICWNTDTKINVGNKTQSATQGKYALFQYVGQVYTNGKKLYVPFGIEDDLLSSLKKNTRVISLYNPEADKFAKLTDITADATKTAQEIKDDAEKRNLAYKYSIAGSDGTEKWNPEMIKVAEYEGTLTARDGKIPLAVRASQTYTLPKLYEFNNERTVFIFKPDGSVENSGSLSARHSVAKNSKSATFTLSINSDGVISLK